MYSLVVIPAESVLTSKLLLLSYVKVWNLFSASVALINRPSSSYSNVLLLLNGSISVRGLPRVSRVHVVVLLRGFVKVSNSPAPL